MIHSLTASLRDELAADVKATRSYDAADWVREAVDTVLAPGLAVRSTVHACVYAMFHGERGAESTFSVARQPIIADPWRERDAVTASLLSAWLVALATISPAATLPSDPLLAGVVALQCLPLVGDPVVTVAEVAR